MKKIGIDVQAAKARKTGLGVYTEFLVQALRKEADNHYQFHFYGRERAKDLNTFERLRWENFELPHEVKNDNLDLLHIPAFAPALFKPCKLVVTIHDLIGMIFPNQKGWPSRFYWGKWLPMTAARADKIIADSENTKKDILKLLNVKPEKIRVIYPSGHESFTSQISLKEIEAVKDRFGIKRPFFLFVGTIEPRKNLKRVIEAFGMWTKKTKSSHQLMIVGAKDFAHGQEFAALQNNGLSDQIIFAGFLKHEELNALYAGALALLFPSLYEGFGLPILEAMASGTPVLTSQTSSLPEVAGNAALLVNPEDTDKIVEGIAHLAEDQILRERLRAQGFERIKQFSWQKTARETIEVYESLLS